jgi:hypothetical protein
MIFPNIWRDCARREAEPKPLMIGLRFIDSSKSRFFAECPFTIRKLLIASCDRAGKKEDMNMKNRRGFTLVELVQVFFLLAIAAAGIGVCFAFVHFLAKFW